MVASAVTSSPCGDGCHTHPSDAPTVAAAKLSLVPASVAAGLESNSEGDTIVHRPGLHIAVAQFCQTERRRTQSGRSPIGQKTVTG